MPEAQKYEHKGRIIRAEMHTSATPQQAWEAWAHSEKIANWFVDRATGEGKPGTTMTWFFDSFGFAQPLQVLDAVPGSLFVLKWDPPPGQGPAGILEVRIARESGETVVRLVNSGFREGAQWNDEYEGVDSGWRISLAILKEYLEHYFGRAKKTEMVLRPAAFDYSRVSDYFLAAPKLADWLTAARSGSASGGIGNVGDACRLALREGGALTGRVLQITKSEVALSWDEIGGAFELKAFSMGPQRMLGVRMTSWKFDGEQLKRVAAQLEPAVARLAAFFPAAAAAGAGPQGGTTSLEEKP